MIINQVVAQGGGSAPEPYPLLSRVKDDSNNEIGTVCGYHTDANNQKYAVVALDAQFRLSSGQYLSDRQQITGIPNYTTGVSAHSATETATTNTSAILDFITGTSYTSSAASHCRSKSFVIGGVTYYGQFPNISELACIAHYRSQINSLDTSATQYSSLVIENNSVLCSSTQWGATACWTLWNDYSANGKNNSYFIIPVLEIPIQ